jgi:hypothetical protein
LTIYEPVLNGVGSGRDIKNNGDPRSCSDSTTAVGLTDTIKSGMNCVPPKKAQGSRRVEN